MILDIFPWRWSSDPKDWAMGIAAIASAFGAVFTAVYVWLTYRLLKATLWTAEMAFREAFRLRQERLEPVLNALKAIRRTTLSLLESKFSDGGIPQAAAVLAGSLHQIDTAGIATTDASWLPEVLRGVRGRVEEIREELTRVLRNGGGFNGSGLVSMSERATIVIVEIDSAVNSVETELRQTGRSRAQNL